MSQREKVTQLTFEGVSHVRSGPISTSGKSSSSSKEGAARSAKLFDPWASETSEAELQAAAARASGKAQRPSDLFKYSLRSEVLDSPLMTPRTPPRRPNPLLTPCRSPGSGSPALLGQRPRRPNPLLARSESDSPAKVVRARQADSPAMAKRPRIPRTTSVPEASARPSVFEPAAFLQSLFAAADELPKTFSAPSPSVLQKRRKGTPRKAASEDYQRSRSYAASSTDGEERSVAFEGLQLVPSGGAAATVFEAPADALQEKQGSPPPSPGPEQEVLVAGPMTPTEERRLKDPFDSMEMREVEPTPGEPCPCEPPKESRRVSVAVQVDTELADAALPALLGKRPETRKGSSPEDAPEVVHPLPARNCPSFGADSFECIQLKVAEAAEVSCGDRATTSLTPVSAEVAPERIGADQDLELAVLLKRITGSTQDPLTKKLRSSNFMAPTAAPAMPLTHVRLPRPSALAPAQAAAAGRPWMQLLKEAEGAAPPAVERLLRTIRSQSALGAREVCNWRLMLRRLLWYLPFLLMAAAYSTAIAYFLGLKECLATAVPVITLLPVPFVAWVSYCDWHLLAAIDQATLQEVQHRLLPPGGLGASASTFAVHLQHGFKELRRGANSLLLAPLRTPLPWRCIVCPSLLIALLVAARASRPYWPELRWQQEIEEGSALAALLLAILVGLSPGASRSRLGLLDERVEALEAALATMLDMFRPLLGSGLSETGTRRLQSSAALGQASAAAKELRFSVRLLTKSRHTIRASLFVEAFRERRKEVERLIISCPLGGFRFAALGVEGAMPLLLGAGFATSLAPAMPRAGHSAKASKRWDCWRSTRKEEESNFSNASVSTASSLVKPVDAEASEAALHAALDTLRCLCRRNSEPLEVFWSRKGQRALLPPKSLEEEPCLVIAIPEEQLRIHDLATPHRCTVCRCRARKDELGVVRSLSEVASIFWGSSEASGTREVLPGSSADAGKCPQHGSATPSGQIVTLFDSIEERDACLALLTEKMVPKGQDVVP